MPRALLANNISTTLSAAITSTAATTFTVTSATGMPAPSGGTYFYCTLIDSSNVPEIVKVTNVTGTTLTCVRAQDGTAARTFLITATVKINLTAAVIAELTATGDTVSFAGISSTGVVAGVYNGLTIQNTDAGATSQTVLNILNNSSNGTALSVTSSAFTGNANTVIQSPTGATTNFVNSFQTYNQSFSANGVTYGRIQNTNAGSTAQAQFNVQASGTYLQLSVLGGGWVTSAGLQANDAVIGNTAAASRFVYQISGTTVSLLTSTGLNSTAVGATTPSTGAFTTLTASTSLAVTGAATASAGFLNPPQRFTGTGVTTVSANAGVRWLNLDSSTITTVTVTFPASPVDGQEFGMISFYTVTGITCSAPGTNLSGTVTTISPIAPASWVFQNATSTWLRTR